jgi:oligopeptide transport system substrate-binding protein
MKRITLSVIAALAAGSLFFFAGCSKKNSSSAKSLNVMIEVEVESLDPQVATDGTSFEVIADFTDGLKQMNADGSTTDALCAGETVSPDGLTYTFKIRDDAKWSNGEPVTADDFVFGWQRAADPKLASEYAYMLSDIGQIKNAAAIEAGKMPVDQLGVKALDSKTFEVTLEVPVSFFDKILYFPTFYPVNKAFFEKCGDKYATSADTVLSDGAFILTDYQPAAVSFKLVKNDKYYDASRVKLAGLNYQVIKDSQQALLSYKNGDLDIIKLAGDQVDQIKDDTEFKSVGAGYLWYISPMMAKVPEFANLNMRKAISFALDRQTIVDHVVKDGSLASYTAVPSQFAYSDKGEDFTLKQDEFPDACSFDAVKAASFYAAAKKELKKDKFSFEMIVDDTEIQQNVAAVIKEQIEKTLPGMTINLRVEPKKQRVADMQDGTFQLVLTRWGPDYADPMTYLGMWVTNNSNNYGLWSNKAYDDLMAKCTTGEFCQKPAERWAAMKQAEKIALDDAVIFPLYQQADACMIKANVKDIEFHAVALNRVFKDCTKD